MSVLVEIMWNFISQTPGLLGSFLGHFMKLLTSEVSRTRLLVTVAEQVVGGEVERKGVDMRKSTCWSFVLTPTLASASLQNHQISSACVKTFMRLLKPPQQSKQKAVPTADKDAAAAGQEVKKDDPREPSQEPLVEGEGKGEEEPPSGEQREGERQQPHAVVDLQVRERKREREKEKERAKVIERERDR